MPNLKLSYFLLLLFVQPLCAQTAWLDQIQSKQYGEKIDVAYIIYDDDKLIPDAWKSNFETGIKHGFWNGSVFKNAHPIEQKYRHGDFVVGGKSAPYLGTIRFQEIKINGEPPADHLTSETSDIEILALLKVYDVISGTLTIARELRYKGALVPITDHDKIAGHFRVVIGQILRQRFLKVVQLQEKQIVEQDGDKLKSIFIEATDHSRLLEAKYLNAYVESNEINNVTTFERIGTLKKNRKKHSKYRYLYNIGKGKKEILAALNQKTPIYLSYKLL